MGKLEIWPVGVLLFLASLACVIEALWKQTPFDTQSTLALLAVIGLPWLMVRSWWARRRERRASSVARDVHHEPPRVRP